MKSYSYDELKKNIKVFDGTSQKEKEEKLKRKFRRVYDSYNTLFEKRVELVKIVNEQNKKIEELQNEIGKI